MNRNNIEKIAATPEDRLLLAKIWDKIHAGIQRNRMAHTCFLAPREQEMARFLFGEEPGLCFFGGYEDAERRMLVYLPDYLDESALTNEDSPVKCLQATYFENDQLTHRDFLGALMGAGIARESVGDILVGSGSSDLFVTEEITSYLLQSFSSAGRTAVHLQRISLQEVVPPQQSFKEIRDTLASLRLDSVVASGFRISRGLAAQYIQAGKAAIDGLPCEKPDKTVAEGQKISLRGAGKIKLVSIGNKTKKDRISVIIHRYI